MSIEFIKCCPFCGAHEVAICRTNKDACWVRCDECGAESESAKTRKKAIANWNRRHDDGHESLVTEDMDRP
jgi:Lar family restriction alleviation protein